MSKSNSSSSSCGFEVIENELEQEYAVSRENGLKFNQVIFDGIFDVYPKDCNVFSTLTFRNNFIQSEGDKVLLLQVGWTSLNEAIAAYEQGLKNTISIDCQNLDDSTDVLYQLCYVTKNNEVVGMSTPWSLRVVQEPDLIEVHKGIDNSMTSKSRFSVLMGMYEDLYTANANLSDKADKPCSVFQKLMEKAQAEQEKNEISVDDENYVEPEWAKIKKSEIENQLKELKSMVDSLNIEVSDTKGAEEKMISEAKILMKRKDEEPDTIAKVEKIVEQFQNVDGSTFGNVDEDPNIHSFCVSLRRSKHAVKKFKEAMMRTESILDKMMQPTSDINLIVGKMNGLDTHRRVLLKSILKHLFPPGERIVFTCEELTDIWRELIEDEDKLFNICKSEETYLRGMKYLQDRLEKFVGLECETYRRVLMCRRKLMNFLVSGGYDPIQNSELDVDPEMVKNNEAELQKNIITDVLKVENVEGIEQTLEDLNKNRQMQPKAGIEEMIRMLSSMHKSVEGTKIQLMALDELCQNNLRSSLEEQTKGTGGHMKKKSSRKNVSETSSENSFSSDISQKEGKKGKTSFEGRTSASSRFQRKRPSKGAVTESYLSLLHWEPKMQDEKFEKPRPQPRNLTKKMDEGPISAYFKKPMKKEPQLKVESDETCMNCEDLRMKCEEMKKRLGDGATAYIDLRIQYEQLKKSVTEGVEDIA